MRCAYRNIGSGPASTYTQIYANAPKSECTSTVLCICWYGAACKEVNVYGLKAESQVAETKRVKMIVASPSHK